MKPFLLSTFLLLGGTGFAQLETVAELPIGVYFTYLSADDIKLNRWERGNVVLLDDSRYKLSTEEETGKYKFSATAQRVFFLTGPLQGVFAKSIISANKPAIILPGKENEKLHSKFFSTDVMACYKRER